MRKPRIFCIVLAGLSVFAARTSLAGTNLVTNGSFENGLSGSQPYSSSTIPSGWGDAGPSPSSASKVNVTATGGGLSAESGNDFLRYQATSTPSSNEDCVQQTLTTVAGAQYIFSFYVAQSGSSTGADFHATWDEGGADSMQIPYTLDSGLSGYVLISKTVTAPTTSTLIDMHGVDPTGSILLDNVSVVLAPEPASLGLLGLSGVGLLNRRRRS